MPFMMRPRMRRINALHGEALAAAVRQRENERHTSIDSEGLLRQFAEADPSRNKSATQWLVRCYLAEGFRLEDLGKVYDTLVAFAHHRKRLPVADRDLGRYRTLADVWKAVRPFAMGQDNEPVTGREARRQERDKARAESQILFEGDDGFTVAVPMTEFASRWWGRGTRWCTAAEKNNAFSSYHEGGPLFVILLPGGQKLQMFATNKDFQLMDADDNPVSRRLFERWWLYLDPIVRWALKRNRNALSYVPERLRDRKMCLEAVRQNGWALNYVPYNLRDREMCFEAVKRCGNALQSVPNGLRNRETCLAAVTQYGLALEFVPEGLRGREMCVVAVKQDGLALRYVPNKFRGRELCLEAVGQHGLALEFVPVDLIDREMCFEAIKQNGKAICFVPENIRNREIYFAAVRQNGNALQFAPENLKDNEMCLKGVKQDGEALYFVPENLRNREIYFEAVRQSGRALQYVPKDLRDREICLEAVRQKGQALEFVPVGLIDREMCLEAVRQNGWALRFVPENLRHRDLYVDAVKRNVGALHYVPKHLRSELREMTDEALIHSKQHWQDDILDEVRLSLQVFSVSDKSNRLVLCL